MLGIAPLIVFQAIIRYSVTGQTRIILSTIPIALLHIPVHIICPSLLPFLLVTSVEAMGEAVLPVTDFNALLSLLTSLVLPGTHPFITAGITLPLTWLA
jgi:hypothetical protein